ncbi:hypothetical protein DAPPUDRAFT_122492 [Daphnia pulex]|uniref:Integrase zinc-binding domain-containing protein n=1 Tax=Daphnia pulex TaxID=6669 RepID=E9I4C9_DAPPU|nr:hypothetical protein DAPPUDRAFT_122492 [Daphnia pulex]|eukprot:EFX61151.1 hypothetical protein DAPPUDRAFT_122492 [Daphnia pulex]
MTSSTFRRIPEHEHLKINPAENTYVSSVTGQLTPVKGSVEIYLTFHGDNGTSITFPHEVFIHDDIEHDFILGRDFTGSEAKMLETPTYMFLTAEPESLDLDTFWEKAKHTYCDVPLIPHDKGQRLFKMLTTETILIPAYSRGLVTTTFEQNTFIPIPVQKGKPVSFEVTNVLLPQLETPSALYEYVDSNNVQFTLWNMSYDDIIIPKGSSVAQIAISDPTNMVNTLSVTSTKYKTIKAYRAALHTAEFIEEDSSLTEEEKLQGFHQYITSGHYPISMTKCVEDAPSLTDLKLIDDKPITDEEFYAQFKISHLSPKHQEQAKTIFQKHKKAFSRHDYDLGYSLENPIPHKKKKQPSKAKLGLRQIKNIPKTVGDRKVKLPRTSLHRKEGVILPVMSGRIVREPNTISYTDFVHTTKMITSGDVTKKNLILAQKDDPQLGAILNLKKLPQKFTMIDNILYHKLETHYRLALPQSFLDPLIHSKHFSVMGLHFSKSRILRDIQTKFFVNIKLLKEKLQMLKENCILCQFNKTTPVQHKLTQSNLIYAPRVTWACDIIPSLPTSKKGHNAMFLAVDMFSGYIQLAPLSNRSAPEMIEALWPNSTTQEEYMALIVPKAEQARKKAREKQQQAVKDKITYRNIHLKSKTFKPGQIVLQRNLQLATGPGKAMQPKYNGPYVIISIDKDQSSALLEHMHSNTQVRAHFSNITLLNYLPSYHKAPGRYDTEMLQFIPEKFSHEKYYAKTKKKQKNSVSTSDEIVTPLDTPTVWGADQYSDSQTVSSSVENLTENIDLTQKVSLQKETIRLPSILKQIDPVQTLQNAINTSQKQKQDNTQKMQIIIPQILLKNPSKKLELIIPQLITKANESTENGQRRSFRVKKPPDKLNY